MSASEGYRWSSDYSTLRRPDPHIDRDVELALARRDGESTLNVGSGPGSYEPSDGVVVACDLSMAMLEQRAQGGAVRAAAEQLPFTADRFDLGMAILTTHHWSSLERGLSELERVCRRRFIIMTFAPEFQAPFWLTDEYLPSLGAEDDGRFVTVDTLNALSSWNLTSTRPVMIPSDCRDGLLEAFWARPYIYLQPFVQAGTSSFALGDPGELRLGLEKLESDLNSGRWERKFAPDPYERSRDFGYRLLTFDA